MSPAEVRRARVSWHYRNLRRAFLDAHPLCRVCGRGGFTVAAGEIDHVVPVKRAPDRFWDQANWQAICRTCHKAKTTAENRRAKSPERAAWRRRLEGMVA